MQRSSGHRNQCKMISSKIILLFVSVIICTEGTALGSKTACNHIDCILLGTGPLLIPEQKEGTPKVNSENQLNTSADNDVSKNPVVEGLYSRLFENDIQDDVQNGGYPNCPVLYTRVGSDCVSFFTPAKIPWAEARQFCLSISGDLISFNNADTYVTLMEYIRNAELTTDFWTAGRYSISKNAWTWSNDDTLMVTGSPYWSLKYTSQCIPRSPQSSQCYYYQQTPQQNVDGWCAAMTYEQYFYLSDALCSEARSPLCLHKPK